MQKKLIALAIAGLSSAAFAQSNVTIYGVMDLTQESVKSEGANAGAANDLQRRGRLSSNSSYIGFKGSEALGNGLTAVFQYESGIAADTAGALAGGRDTFVGLAGGFGTIAAGTLTHPYRALGAKVDFNPGASSIGFTGSMYGQISVNSAANGTIKTGTDDRATNAVAYISPNFGGFTATVAYVNGENRPANQSVTNTKAWQVAGTYDNGPLFVGFAHHNADDSTVLATVPGTAAQTLNLDANTKVKANRIAAVYAFGTGTKVSALWDSQKATFNTLAADAKRTAWMIGASHTFGANQVYLQFAKAKNPTGNAITANTDAGAKQVTLGYAYSLSKRTTAHAYYSKISNNANGTYDFYVNPVSGTATAAAGADPVGYGVGLRHTF